MWSKLYSMTHLRMTQGVVAIALAALVILAYDIPIRAAESKGECYILNAGASGSEDVQTDAWRGPTTANIGRCAALAGEAIEQTTDDTGTGTARWQDVEIIASKDGSYQVFRAGQLERSGFWKMEALVEVAMSDIDQFWQREFEARGWDYAMPKRVQGYDGRIRTACGRSVPNNAFYCRASHSIYYDFDLFEGEFSDIGDAAPRVIVAHEWGHAIQSLRSNLRRTRSVFRLEQQADCFAGAYVGDASTRAVFDESDVQEAKDLFSSLRGNRSHGTSRQRAAAFQKGFDGGVDACLS